MAILYFSWNEALSDTFIRVMHELNYRVKRIIIPYTRYDRDESFMSQLMEEISLGFNGEAFDCVFSFNYFPDISRVCDKLGVIYISWVYDSPHLTLQSKTLLNKTNKVFLFDYALFEKYLDEGIDTVNYLPLPSRIIETKESIKYKYDICFLGSLYNGKQDQYGSVESLPDYLKGYLDAIISSQMRIYGADIIDYLVGEKLYNEIKNYVIVELGDDYRKSGLEIFKDMLRKRVTMIERREVLTRLGGKYKVDLYTGSNYSGLPVCCHGYADYYDEMPGIFRSTKINLNISLKSIKTGIPLRVMDILGAGGFCITNYQTEIAEYFENGVDLVWYESMEDLENKVEYYLNHDSEREAIARNGQKKVEKLFSYEKQLKSIFDLIP